MKRIFNISCTEDLMAIKMVMGEGFMKVEGWLRVNNGVASIFIENFIILHPLKLDVVNLDTHWVRPSFCGNLNFEVAECNILLCAENDGDQDPFDVYAGAFKDLEKHFRILLEFIEILVAFARDRNSVRARIKLPNVKSLSLPMGLVLGWWKELRDSA
ncbi:hypothetical protein KI387_022363, partial [Taxus chinensis]